MDDLISRLSEIRSEYNCFDENEEPYYRALSESIKILSRREDRDTISRQAAIDAIRASTSKYTGFMEMEMYTDDDAVEAINGVPSAQQWTPCSERLPMTKDDYIITVKDKSLTWTDYVEWSADYHWWGYDDDMVIAWMPLPEPYKGE